MISLLAKVISLLAFIIQRIWLLASFVGKIIVSTLTAITSAVYRGIENVLLFLQIVYEDNMGIFYEDIPTFVNEVMETCDNQLHYIQNGLLSIFTDLITKFGVVAGSVKYFINSILIVVFEVLKLFKDTSVFVGNTVWFILTFIPVHLPQLIQVGFKYLKKVLFDIVVDAYMVLLKITNFMTDVPLESFIGITSAIVLVRLTINYRLYIQTQIIKMYWLILRKVLYMYYALYNYLMDSEVRVITHMATGQDVVSSEVSQETNTVEENNGSDALCIICQERQKCVLTLPCRHVCLCAECCRRLYGYQRTCPICRTFIYHSVTVYL